MKVNFFIDHPVFSIVISILIVIVGFIGLTLLPIDQYPQITPPVVKISASYPGASALTVSQAVATPIEQELNGTPGMIYMESSSYIRRIDRCQPCRRRSAEPVEAGRVESAGRSRAKRYLGRETGCQPVDDDLPYIGRPQIRRNLSE